MVACSNDVIVYCIDVGTFFLTVKITQTKGPIDALIFKIIHNTKGTHGFFTEKPCFCKNIGMTGRHKNTVSDGLVTKVAGLSASFSILINIHAKLRFHFFPLKGPAVHKSQIISHRNIPKAILVMINISEHG